MKKIFKIIIFFLGVCFFDNIGQATEKYTLLNLDKYNYNILNINYSVMNNKYNFSPPIINTKLKSGLTELDYTVDKIDYNKESYNFFVLYKKNIDSTIEEVFRTRIYNSGKNKIIDSKVLNYIKNNGEYFTNLEVFYIKENNIINKQYSNNSKIYYTPREYNLEIEDIDNNILYENLVVDNSIIEENNILINLDNFKKYIDNKYYTYKDCKIFIDGKEIENINSIIKVPYNFSNLKIKLFKNKENWTNVTIKYPNKIKEDLVLSVKKDMNFQEFYKENITKFSKDNIDNYLFKNYYINNIEISNYNKSIKENTDIYAVYNVEVIIKNDEKTETLYLNTGYELENINFNSYNKVNYDIVSYKLTNNKTNEIEILDNLKGVKLDGSITIEPQYKDKTSNVQLRQDEYNSRFGKVDESIKNKDFKVSKNAAISEFLNEIKDKIIANDGYEVQFRVNKKIVDINDKFSDDCVLEIYFKKIDSKWITVKFVGEGIDKFLSDGQEVLVGDNLDKINLPTSTGASKELLGWKVNRNYILEKNNEKLEKNKNDILKLEDIPNIVAQKGENLIFNAEYEETYVIDLESKNFGKVVVANANNKLNVVKGFSIKDTVKNKIIFLPQSHYRFSHFTSTLPVVVEDKNEKFKIINTGEKITLEDFYNIVPSSNLTLYANFAIYNGIFDDLLYIEDYSEDIFNMEKNSYNEFKNILGPFNFLR